MPRNKRQVEGPQPFVPLAKSGESTAPLAVGRWNEYQVDAWPVEKVRISSRQVRRHGERQLAKIAANIQQLGFVDPILVKSDGEVIDGVARLEAAKRLGMTLVPAICIEGRTDAQIRALRISLNKLSEMGEWEREALGLEFSELINLDFNTDLTGFESAAVDLTIDALSAKPNLDADPADQQVAPPKHAITQLGNTWLLGEHRLTCGDALKQATYEALMRGDLARLVIADVPFNVRIQGHVSGLGKVRHNEFAMASGDMTEPQFTEFLTNALILSRQHLVPGGVAYFFIDGAHTHEMTTAQRAAKFKFLNLVCWAKTNAGMGSLYRSQTEYVFVFKKGNEPHVNQVQLGKFGRYRTTLWSYPGMNSFGKDRDENLALHPTLKNTEMIADAIRDVSHRRDVVLDPFVGSGTTILAAERTGRRARAIDIEPAFVDVAIGRWSTMTGKQAVLESTGQTFEEVARERKEGLSLPIVDKAVPRYRVRTRTRPVVTTAAEG